MAWRSVVQIFREQKRGSVCPWLAMALTLVLTMAVVQLMPVEAFAHGYKLGNISVGHVWAPPPGKGAKGIAVYGPIMNHGGTTARLIGAASPVAERARFRVVRNGHVMWLKTIALHPNKPVSLAAWRAHIWLSGIRKPIADGDSFKVILDFGDAGRLPVEVVVEEHGSHH